MHNNEHAKLENEWLMLKDQRESLLSGKAFESVTAKSFSKEKQCVCCIDERVANRETLSGKTADGRWTIAGSGILLPIKSWPERAKFAAEEAFKRGIREFSYHAGCGAAGIAVKQDLEQLADPDTLSKNSDLYGEIFAKAAQEELNKQWALVGEPAHEAFFVGKEEVLPGEYHNALGAVVDATSEFKAASLPEDHPLRKCFNLEWSSGGDTGYNLVEIKTAAGIAFGGHGFGNKFDNENPFAVVVVGNDYEQIEIVKEKISSYIEKEAPDLKERLKVLSFVKPVEKRSKPTKFNVPAEVRAGV